MPSFLSHAGARYPITDAVETNNFYELQANVPGFDKKYVQVEVHDSHTIVLKGSTEQKQKITSLPTSLDKQEATEGTTQRVVATAIDEGKIFHLPMDIDPQTTKAIVPKTKGKKSASIDID